MNVRRIAPYLLILFIALSACYFSWQQQRDVVSSTLSQMQDMQREHTQLALDDWQNRVRFFLTRAAADQSLQEKIASGEQVAVVQELAAAAEILHFTTVMLHDRNSNTLYMSDAPSKPGELYGLGDFLLKQYGSKPAGLSQAKVRENSMLLFSQPIRQNNASNAVLILGYSLDQEFINHLTAEVRHPLRLELASGSVFVASDKGLSLPLQWQNNPPLDTQLFVQVPTQLDDQPGIALIVIFALLIMALSAASIWLDWREQQHNDAELDRIVGILRTGEKSQITLHTLAQKGGSGGRVAAALLDAMQQHNERRQKLEAQVQSLQLHTEEMTNKLGSAIRDRDLAITAPRTKSEFLSRMGDEITSPMNSMMSMLSILSQRNMPPEEKELVVVAIRAARALTENLNNIMDFSKLDANLLRLNKQDFPVKSLVESVVSNYTHLAQAKQLRLTWNVSVDVPDAVHNDAARIQHILNNLVGNAVRFTKDGEVGIYVDMWTKENKQLLRFTVSDTGVGIPKDAIVSLFDSLETRSKLTNASFAGRLRLIVAKMLAELMGGEIGVTSIPGQGSRFWFTISL